jgi:type IV pilus assembly protein PilP
MTEQMFVPRRDGRVAWTCALLAVLALAGLHGPARAADRPQGSAPAAAATAAPPAAAAGQGYSYDPAGRRDPFVSLVNRGSETRSASSMRPAGLGGLSVDEVALHGIVKSRAVYVAMIQAPDGKNYTVRSGDRLLDGTVKAVTDGAVVFTQQVSDPLSLVKQREVRKPLRPTEEGK